MKSNILYCFDTRLIIVLFGNIDSITKKLSILPGNIDSNINKEILVI